MQATPTITKTALFAGVAFGAMMFAAAAYAQAPAAPATPTPEEIAAQEAAAAEADSAAAGSEEVVVTGSRIKKPEFESIYPTSSVTSEQFERRGITNVLDALNTIPSTGIGATPVGTQASFGAGAAFVNLFDLGTARTLTLVDGQRFIGGNQSTLFGQAGSGLQVDLNVIPTALIERIDVVSVGGAPTYGADAIAGTVNVILKRNFVGYEGDSQFGQYQDGFGSNWRVRGLAGVNFDNDKGNVAISAEWNKTEGFTDEVSARRNSSFSFVPNPRNGAPFTSVAEPNGVFDNYLIRDRRLPSLTTGGAIFRTGGAPTYLTAADRTYLLANPTVNPVFGLTNTTGALITRNSTATELAAGARARRAVPLLFNPDGTIRDMNVGLIAADQVLTQTNSVGGDGLNLAPFTALQTELDRKLLTGIASYEFSPNFRVRGNFFFADVKGTEPTNQPGFNSNAFGGVSIALGFRTDNPFLTAQARSVLLDPALDLQAASTVINNSQNAYSSFGSAGAFAGCGVVGMDAAIQAGCPAPAAGEKVFFTSRIYDDIIGLAPSVSTGRTYRTAFAADYDFEAFEQEWTFNVNFLYGQSIGESRNTSILQAQFNAARDAVSRGGNTICRVNSPTGAEKDAARFFFRYTNVNPGTAFAAKDPSSPTPPAGFFRRLQNDPLAATEASLDQCQPLNLFGRGASSLAARQYVTGFLETANVNQQWGVEANLSGTVIDLPGGPLQVALGASWRKEQSSFTTRSELARFGLGRSVAIADTGGSFTSTEFYGEIEVPLLGEGFNTPWMQDVSVTGAYRYIDNELAGSDRSWTLGFIVAPQDWITFRGNLTRSVRAPALTELYLPSSDSFATAADPCDSTLINSGAVPAIRRANCEAQAAGFGFAGLPTFISNVRFATVRGTNSGNPDLQNEVAESKTFGFVLQPDVIGKMALAVDWVEIKLTNSIENFGLLSLMQSCYDNASFPTGACARFTRDPATFQIVLGSATDPAFRAGFVNAGYRNFEGITGTFDWSFELAELLNAGAEDYGVLGFRLQYSYYETLESSVLGTGTDLDIQNGEVSRPNNESVFTASYTKGPASVQLVWSHQGEAKFDVQFSDENREQKIVSAYDKFDLNLQYDITEEFQARLIINNLFDTEAPFPSSSIAYDQLGRFWSVGLRARF